MHWFLMQPNRYYYYMTQQIHNIKSSLLPASILQVISQLQWVGSTSSAASLRATRTWRSRPCCPSPTQVWPVWTQLGISLKAWRSPWRRPNTSLELWPSSTSSCPWRRGTQSASTSSPANWPTPLNPWPSSVGCCCMRPSDWMESLWVKHSAREHPICLLDCKRQSRWLNSQRDWNNWTGFIQQGNKYFIFYFMW